MKALVFGGAFNPPTRAHIDLACYALKQTGYDKVIFVPSKMRYIEEDQGKNFAFTDSQRLAMLESVAAGHDWMEVCDYELNSRQQPRTYVTLTYLKEQGYECSLLFGSDKLPELEHGWRFVDEICRNFGIVCMERSGDDCASLIAEDPYLSSLREYIRIVPTPPEYHGISSSEVRDLYLKAAADLKAIRALVPKELDGLIGYLKKETES